MCSTLSLEGFLLLAASARRVAVHHTIATEGMTPLGVAANLQTELKAGVILESSLLDQGSGRYSLIAINPISKFEVKGQEVIINDRGKIRSSTLSPMLALQNFLNECAVTQSRDVFSPTQNAIGFLTYDAVRLLENIPDQHEIDKTIPEIFFQFYETTLVFDHQKKQLQISHAVEMQDNLENIYHDARNYIEEIINRIKNKEDPKKMVTVDQQSNFLVQTDVSDKDFMQQIERAKEYIRDGEAFQIVLSRKFTTQYHVSEFDIYRSLCERNPSPYLFYLTVGDKIIVGASPEKFVSVNNNQVEINPIAGTRGHQDKTLEAIVNELSHDPKEKAEHLMLVDLARNDIGKVCDPGSIEVSELMRIKHYSHVSHMISTIRGKLNSNKKPLDALFYAFPAGTLSGAPKIRAMQIIDELESSRRGMYGGVICRIGQKNDLDSCIAIRMAVLHKGTAIVRTGAGIVFDSNPIEEVKETRHKAKGVLEAIRLAKAGAI